ncbi:MAG: 50S ribosomal protein L10 [Candidatus Amoebophilus sp. 36-38]|nr:MAG: 50S ribosomal protein L10 [Candidatus Amoebophilus sp. 36-38]
MNRQEKTIIIKDLAEKFRNNNCFYIVDSTSLSVQATNQFRRECRQVGVSYRVAKNTLILKALDEMPGMNGIYESLRDKVLKGFSGILFFNENANIPAKLVQDFRKEKNLDRPILKGAYIDGELFVGDENLEALTKLKSKQVLIGEIIGLLQSPMANVLSALQSGKTQISGIIKTLGDRKE